MKTISNEEITSRFLTATDKVAIEQNMKNFVFTFRECGEATILRLNGGAGAKPHDILEKTIKTDNVASYLTRLTAAFKDPLQGYQDFKGFVGHWVGQNLRGVYLTTYGKDLLADSIYSNQYESITTTIGEKDYERFYLKLIANDDKLNYKAVLNFLKEKCADKWQSCFFTGDYDLHDIISTKNYLIEIDKQDPNYKVSEFRRFLKTVNKVINDANANWRNTIAENYHKDYNRVQHGAQFSYIAHMLNFEFDKYKKVELVEKVMKMSLPLLAFNRGSWQYIQNASDYKEFIESLGLKVKAIWLSEEDFNKFLQRLEKTYKKRVTVV